MKGFRVNVKREQTGDVYCPFPTVLSIPTVDRFRTVSCGYNHTAAVSMDGTFVCIVCALRCTGGWLKRVSAQAPIFVFFCVCCCGGGGVVGVVGGGPPGDRTLLGRLFVWGSGNSGRLGLGGDVLGEVHTPTLVRGLVAKGIYVWSVACGAAHTAITTRIEVRRLCVCMGPPPICSCSPF